MLKNGSSQDALLLTAQQEAAWGNAIQATVRDDLSDSSQDELVLSGGPCSPTETYHYPNADLANLVAQINTGSACVDATRPGASPPSGPLAYVTNTPFAPGITSYFVLVSKDASFSNIVDYAFVRVPAYAPRTSSNPTTYSDETTLYYWAVLPASTVNGGVAAGNPFSAAAGNFQKQSTPPTQLSPSSVQVFLDQPTFRWTPTLGPGAIASRSRQIPRSAIRSTTRHRRHVLLEQHDLSGRHRPLLARPRRRREPDRPDLVGDGNLPEEAGRAPAERVEPGLRATCCPCGHGAPCRARRRTTSRSTRPTGPTVSSTASALPRPPSSR